jgi:uncharacterized membrane protein
MIFLLLVQVAAVLIMIVGVMVLLIGGKELRFRNNVPAGLAEMALGSVVCWGVQVVGLLVWLVVWVMPMMPSVVLMYGAERLSGRVYIRNQYTLW